jgi:hypothetical protein
LGVELIVLTPGTELIPGVAIELRLWIETLDRWPVFNQWQLSDPRPLAGGEAFARERRVADT